MKYLGSSRNLARQHNEATVLHEKLEYDPSQVIKRGTLVVLLMNTIIQYHSYQVFPPLEAQTFISGAGAQA